MSATSCVSMTCFRKISDISQTEVQLQFSCVSITGVKLIRSEAFKEISTCLTGHNSFKISPLKIYVNNVCYCLIIFVCCQELLLYFSLLLLVKDSLSPSSKRNVPLLLLSHNPARHVQGQVKCEKHFPLHFIVILVYYCVSKINSREHKNLLAIFNRF